MEAKKFYTVMINEGSKNKTMERFTVIVDKFKTNVMFFGERGEHPDVLLERIINQGVNNV